MPHPRTALVGLLLVVAALTAILLARDAGPDGDAGPIADATE